MVGREGALHAKGHTLRPSQEGHQGPSLSVLLELSSGATSHFLIHDISSTTTASSQMQIEDDEYMMVEGAELSVSSRCQVDPGNKRGSIRHALHHCPSSTKQPTTCCLLLTATSPAMFACCRCMLCLHGVDAGSCDVQIRWAL